MDDLGGHASSGSDVQEESSAKRARLDEPDAATTWTTGPHRAHLMAGLTTTFGPAGSDATASQQHPGTSPKAEQVGTKDSPESLHAHGGLEQGRTIQAATGNQGTPAGSAAVELLAAPGSLQLQPGQALPSYTVAQLQAGDQHSLHAEATPTQYHYSVVHYGDLGPAQGDTLDPAAVGGNAANVLLGAAGGTPQVALQPAGLAHPPAHHTHHEQVSVMAPLVHAPLDQQSPAAMAPLHHTLQAAGPHAVLSSNVGAALAYLPPGAQGVPAPGHAVPAAAVVPFPSFMGIPLQLEPVYEEGQAGGVLPGGGGSGGSGGGAAADDPAAGGGPQPSSRRSSPEESCGSVAGPRNLDALVNSITRELRRAAAAPESAQQQGTAAAPLMVQAAADMEAAAAATATAAGPSSAAATMTMPPFPAPDASSVDKSSEPTPSSKGTNTSSKSGAHTGGSNPTGTPSTEQ